MDFIKKASYINAFPNTLDLVYMPFEEASTIRWNLLVSHKSNKSTLQPWLVMFQESILNFIRNLLINRDNSIWKVY